MAFYPGPLPFIGLNLETPGAVGVSAAAPLPSLSTLLDTGSGRVLQTRTAQFAINSAGAILKGGYKLAADTGAFAITDVDADLTKGTGPPGVEAPAPLPCLTYLLVQDPTRKVLFARAGSFAFTFPPTTLRTGKAIVAAPGNFVLGFAPGTNDYQLNATKGTFTLTGNAIGMVRPRALSAAPGSFVVTGKNAQLNYQQPGAPSIIADPGEFIIEGNPATFVRTYVLTAQNGSFTITTMPATFRSPHWAPVLPTSVTWIPVATPVSVWRDAA